MVDELNLKSLRYHDHDYEVELDTEISPELRLEGLARELVRRIQGMRKDAGFNVEDRVDITWRADGEVAEAARAWKGHVSAETLAVTFDELPVGATAPAGWFEGEHRVEGHTVWLAVRQTSAS